MKLYLNTVSDQLWDALNKLMADTAFDTFRLVGGTSLSLQLGHRESIDIDLFTDAAYGSLDLST
ncbi:MAG: nucleotidyl transferase AbiEii/AbiGii toxin family protein [Bacteroidetes bacterium]|nr:nucleotidyl transferase AbiEii/AbiGii toxin family protein [Bacteroidota bacterium]MDA1144901.1 nucleotidyl transferase AbiEii/AbiGii toxin family protein [Bacteroidota bacterium]